MFSITKGCIHLCFCAGRKQAPKLTSLETGISTVLKNEHFPLKYEMKNSQGKMGCDWKFTKIKEALTVTQKVHFSYFA